MEESQNDAASHALLLIAGSPDTVNPIDGQSSAGSPVPVSADDVIVLAELPEKSSKRENEIIVVSAAATEGATS